MWRESWASLVSSQLQIVTEYEGLYDPIVGATDGQSRAAPTPSLQLERTFKLKTAYTELQTELVEEMIQIEGQVVKPATEARECIAPIRKTIKKRENKRLDYEKTQEKALKLQRKPGRTPKEDVAFVKAEAERSRAADVRIALGWKADFKTDQARNLRSRTTTSEKRYRPSSTRPSAWSPRYYRIWL
jgi:hypothetical protein